MGMGLDMGGMEMDGKDGKDKDGGMDGMKMGEEDKR
jgi:hypothetical protein